MYVYNPHYCTCTAGEKMDSFTFISKFLDYQIENKVYTSELMVVGNTDHHNNDFHVFQHSKVLSAQEQ